MKAQGRFDKTVIGGMVVIGVILALMVLPIILPTILGGPKGQTVKARFVDAKQLHPGDLVRIDGVDAGAVDRIVADPGGGSATVTMRLNDSAGPIYADATAAARFRLVLGANFYVRLDRGTSNADKLGSRVIPPSRTDSEVELEDITSVARGGARTGLQTLPRELAKSLSDPSAVTRTLRTLADVSPWLTSGLRGLRGQVVDKDLRDLVTGAAATVQGLDTPTDQIRELVSGAAATLQTTAARRADISDVLRRAPGVMARTDLTLDQLDRTLALADPVVTTLQKPAPDVARTLRTLQPTVVGASRLLDRATPLLHALRPAVTSLARVARQGRPLLNGLQPSIDRLDKTILPYLAELDPQTQHATYEMIGPTLGGLGPGAAGPQDQNGHFIRFPATVGSSPLYLPCQIYAGNPDADKLIECQSLQQALDDVINYKPLADAPARTGDR